MRPRQIVGLEVIGSLSDLHTIDVPLVFGALGGPALIGAYEGFRAGSREDYSMWAKQVGLRGIIPKITGEVSPYSEIVDSIFEHVERDRGQQEDVRRREVLTAYSVGDILINLLANRREAHDDNLYEDIRDLRNARSD